jgi:dTDP-4-amino-4,6-dideoxygalactose transaminase
MSYKQAVLAGVRGTSLFRLCRRRVASHSGYPYPIYHNQLFNERPHVIHPCPVAEAYCRSSVWLPHNALLADKEWIEEALAAINKVCGNADDFHAQPTNIANLSPGELTLPVSGPE